MYEAPTIIGNCINCIAPGSLGATLALILIGAFVVAHSERRKLVAAKTRAAPGQPS
jgi:hypothetical protein